MQSLSDFLPGNWLWVVVTIASAATAYVLLVHLLLRRWLANLLQRTPNLPILGNISEHEDKVKNLVSAALGLALLSAALLLALALLGVDTSPATSRLKQSGLDLGGWLAVHGLRILLIVVVSYLAQRWVGRALQPVIRTTLVRGKEGLELEEAAKRASALGQVTQYAVTALVYTIAVIMVISELGFELAPILAGVGIAGIALGFGAQNLVRDVISGAFVLLEDQYRVGDVASVGGKTGLVEGVNLRRTILRDLDGIVHTVPNGQITVASNYTKSFSRVNLDVSVAYKEDLNHVFRVLNRVGDELARDDYFGPLILETPQVVRVNSFDQSGIAVKVLGVTRPIRQWEVMGELRRRIKEEFDKEGIEIPFPHQTLYWGVESHPRAEPGPYTRGLRERRIEDSTGLLMRSRDPWAQEAEGGASGPQDPSGRAVPNLIGHLEEVRTLLKSPPVALLTDIDGTLAAIAPNPRLARVTAAVREALGQLSRRITVAVLTGRDVTSARAVLGLSSVTYHGNHGIETWERGNTTILPEAQPLKRQIQRLRREARERLEDTPGVSIEDKGVSLALHYRQAPDPGKAREALLDFLARTPEARGLTIYEGKMVVEAHVNLPVNKGTALQRVVEGRGIRSALVLGDDLTDLDSFQMLSQLRAAGQLQGFCVAVLGSNTPAALLAAADYHLADVEAVDIFLTWLAEQFEPS